MTPTTSPFRRLVVAAAEMMGSPWAFLVALSACVIWAIAGPIFGYSDTWQLTINTGTTIITFLVMFLVQNTQNRDALATQLKLDELLRAVDSARTGLVDLEHCSDEELTRLRREFGRLADKAGRPTGSGA